MRSLLLHVYSPLHDEGLVEETVKWIEARIGWMFDDVERASAPEKASEKASGDYGFIAISHITGGSEQMALRAAALGRPTALIAHSKMNSLPAALETISALKSRGIPSWVIPLWREGAERRLENVMRAAEAAWRLKGHRIMVLGDPSPWLIYSLPDTRVLSRLGVEIVKVSLKELMRELRPGKEDEDEARRLVARSESAHVRVEDVAKALTLYGKIKRMMWENGADSVTIRCFDLIKDAGTTACLAVSMLNDDGLVAGCESDIPSTLSMVIAHTLSRGPVFMANPALVEGDRILLAHCTVAMGLSKSYRLMTHFESGLGVGVAGVLAEGVEATLMRISAEADVLRAGVGEIVSGKPSREGYCRTQVELRIPGAEKILREPMGNHYVMALGDIMDGLEAFAEITGMRFDRIG